MHGVVDNMLPLAAATLRRYTPVTNGLRVGTRMLDLRGHLHADCHRCGWGHHGIGRLGTATLAAAWVLAVTETKDDGKNEEDNTRDYTAFVHVIV